MSLFNVHISIYHFLFQHIDKRFPHLQVGLCVSKLEPAIVALVNPSLGLQQPNQKDQQKARDDVLALLGHLNTYLEDRTFLVGERGTIADVFLAAYLAPLFEYVLLLILRVYSHRID